mmetsp:Transcript_104436/g.302154  ORF Transcript_104436/g.302154 Transcript_104436/m.302154 type:complete len:298 (-) Transcript_104436:1417-2310(-)
MTSASAAAEACDEALPSAAAPPGVLAGGRTCKPASRSRSNNSRPCSSQARRFWSNFNDCCTKSSSNKCLALPRWFPQPPWSSNAARNNTQTLSTLDDRRAPRNNVEYVFSSGSSPARIIRNRKSIAASKRPFAMQAAMRHVNTAVLGLNPYLRGISSTTLNAASKSRHLPYNLMRIDAEWLLGFTPAASMARITCSHNSRLCFLAHPSSKLLNTMASGVMPFFFISAKSSNACSNSLRTQYPLMSVLYVIKSGTHSAPIMSRNSLAAPSISPTLLHASINVLKTTRPTFTPCSFISS